MRAIRQSGSMSGMWNLMRGGELHREAQAVECALGESIRAKLPLNRLANGYYRRRSVMSRQGRLHGRDGERGTAYRDATPSAIAARRPHSSAPASRKPQGRAREVVHSMTLSARARAAAVLFLVFIARFQGVARMRRGSSAGPSHANPAKNRETSPVRNHRANPRSDPRLAGQ
jgi:hypothetical protein